MANDVWTALVKGTLAFGQTRAAGFVGDAFKDSGSFVAALAEDPIAQTPDIKSRFEKLKQDIRDAKAGRSSTSKTNQGGEGRIAKMTAS
jgi:hypothetical protein